MVDERESLGVARRHGQAVRSVRRRPTGRRPRTRQRQSLLRRLVLAERQVSTEVYAGHVSRFGLSGHTMYSLKILFNDMTSNNTHFMLSVDADIIVFTPGSVGPIEF